MLFIDCASRPRGADRAERGRAFAARTGFGSGNPEPLLILEGAKIAEAKQIGGGKHTKLILEKDGIRCEGVYFGLNLLQTNFYAGDEVDAVFNLSVNDYMNIKTAQLILRDMRLTGVSAAYLEQGRRLYEAIQRAAKSRRQKKSYRIEKTLQPYINILRTRCGAAMISSALRASKTAMRHELC